MSYNYKIIYKILIKLKKIQIEFLVILILTNEI